MERDEIESNLNTFFQGNPKIGELFSRVIEVHSGEGEILLFGSAVYGTILALLQGRLPIVPKDWDFLAETQASRSAVAVQFPGHEVTATVYGALKILNPGREHIDLAAAEDFPSNRRGFGLEGIVDTTPLSSQRIAYSLRTGHLVGAGLPALIRGIVAVHNHPLLIEKMVALGWDMTRLKGDLSIRAATHGLKWVGWPFEKEK